MSPLFASRSRGCIFRVSTFVRVQGRGSRSTIGLYCLGSVGLTRRIRLRAATWLLLVRLVVWLFVPSSLFPPLLSCCLFLAGISYLAPCRGRLFRLSRLSGLSCPVQYMAIISVVVGAQTLLLALSGAQPSALDRGVRTELPLSEVCHRQMIAQWWWRARSRLITPDGGVST